MSGEKAKNEKCLQESAICKLEGGLIVERFP